MKRILTFLLFLPSIAHAQWELTPNEGTAAQKRVFVTLVDDTDGKTPETGITVSTSECQISEAGAAFANCGGTWTELSDGAYYYEPASGEVDTAGNHLLKIEKTGVRLTFASWQIHELESADFAADGTAQAGASGSITLASGASATDDLYNGRLVTVVSGTGSGQSRLISDYVGSTKVASITPNWTTTPDNTSKYILSSWGTVPSLGTGSIVAASFGAGAIDATAVADNTIDAGAIASNAITAAKIATDAIADDELSSSLTVGIVGNITGNLSGSVGSVTGAVGSVTGAVGSVTGNVGGNVVGTVADVTASVTVDDFTSGALAEFLLTNTGTTSASAAEGSVAKEISDLGGGGGGGASWDDLVVDHRVAGSFGEAVCKSIVRAP